MSDETPPERGRTGRSYQWIPILITAVAAIGGLVFTGLSLRSTEQGQITDRYGKAVEQLGSTEAEVQVGGIFGLERISRDSPEDQATVVDVLSAFVQHRAPVGDGTSCALAARADNPMPVNIQAAARVLARRSPQHDGGAQVRLLTVCLQRLMAPHANLPYSDLSQAILTGANLDHADLRGAILSDAQLTCGDIDVAETCVYLEHGNLTEAFVSNADLSGADLLECTFTKAMLVGTKLTRANLGKADFTGAQMVSSILRGATLADARLPGAVLARADLSTANASGADMSEADLTEANLANAVLFATNLRGAHLNNANLSGAVLVGADLSDADLTGARLDGANLAGATLNGAIGLAPR